MSNNNLFSLTSHTIFTHWTKPFALNFDFLLFDGKHVCSQMRSNVCVPTSPTGPCPVSHPLGASVPSSFTYGFCIENVIKLY